VVTDDGKVRLATARLLEQAQRLDAIFAEETASYARGEMRLISKRMHSTHNSWTQNIPELTNGEMGQTNYLYMHPDDARAKGLSEKSPADVHSPTNTIRLPVKLLDTLMPGTVAIPHGWGHQHARGLSVASRLSGVNVNLLAADGADAVESISGMAHLTGIPVRVEPAAGPIDPRSWTGIAEGAAAA
jgi:formate dehydrogenase